MRHDKIKESFAKIRHGVCYDVKIEPPLQLLESKSFYNKLLELTITLELTSKQTSCWDPESAELFSTRKFLTSWRIEAEKKKRKQKNTTRQLKIQNMSEY